MIDSAANQEALQGWLTRLEQSAPAIRMSLDSLEPVAREMGFQFDALGLRLSCSVVVVGGTNGKGSTCAFMESIALAAGYKTAVYSSPHLLCFEERLRINGENSTAKDWIEAFTRVDKAQAACGSSLSYFEFVTLAAVSMVDESPPDLAIFEIGMGGRLDAVNLLANDAAVLTSVDLDHQAYLGDTREKIGWEKAHIARAGRPFVVGDPTPPVSVMEVAQARGALPCMLGRDFSFQGDRQQWSWNGRQQRRNALAYPALRGANQLLNASSALAAFECLADRLPISQGAVREGLAKVSLPGRFQVLPGQPAVVLDVAHNPHAAGVLAANLDQMGFYPKTIAVVGLLADKDARAVFERLHPRVDVWCLADLTDEQAGSRARSADALRVILQEVLGAATSDKRQGLPPVEFFIDSSPLKALVRAQSLAEPSDRLVVFGSFLIVASVWSVAQKIGQAPHAPHAH